MRADMLAAHQAGRIRAVKVRASDYIEANSVLSAVVGKPLDVPHSSTSVHNCARTLVTVAGEQRAHGQVWFAPTNPALTVRQMVTRFAEVNDALAPKLTPISYPVMWAPGLFTPLVKELRTTRYQFTRPFVIDSSATRDVPGLKPITLEVALRDAAARLRA
jgi:hypothetical protein